MYGRMPVVAAVERRGQFSWWGSICIAIQGVANVIRVLFVHASECEIGEPLSRVPAFWAAALIVDNKINAPKMTFIG